MMGESIVNTIWTDSNPRETYMSNISDISDMSDVSDMAADI